MNDVASIRRGDAADVIPGLFPDGWTRPMIANFVDTVSRDLAETIAPLPAFNCSTGKAVSERSRQSGSKRTKIVAYYSICSKLDIQMISAADRYLTYGFTPFIVEPNFEEKRPHIRVADSMGCYPEIDIWGNVRSLAQTWQETIAQLCSRFPEHAAKLRGDDKGPWQQEKNPNESMVTVVKYYDDHQMLLYVPERKNLVLANTPNRFGKCPVRVAVRPGLDEESRGAWDDVLWVQLARAKMAFLGMDAAEKSVRAPLAVPSDTQEVAFGGDAIIRSTQPEKIRRVGLEMSPAAFQESALLQQEMNVGARSPSTRQGAQDASIITGRGVQELSATFDTQVSTA